MQKIPVVQKTPHSTSDCKISTTGFHLLDWHTHPPQKNITMQIGDTQVVGTLYCCHVCDAKYFVPNVWKDEYNGKTATEVK